MKITFIMLVMLFLISCSDFEPPSKEEIKDKISENIGRIDFETYEEKIEALKDSLSIEEYDSLKSQLADAGKYFDTRIWRWFRQIENIVADGNIDEAYSLVTEFESLANVEEFEKDLLKFVRMALDNRSGESDIPILKVILESDLIDKYGEEIGTIILGVAVIAFNPHGGMF